VKKWKPKAFEKFFYLVVGGTGIFTDIRVEWSYHHPIEEAKPIMKIGNCYRLRSEAQAARRRVLKALKGEA